MNLMSGATSLCFVLVQLLRDPVAVVGRSLVVRVARDSKKTRSCDLSRRGHTEIAANVDCTVYNDDT